MTPEARKIVQASLKSLTRARFKEMCRLKTLRAHPGDIVAQEKAILMRLKSIQNKIEWEVNKYHDALSDQ